MQIKKQLITTNNKGQKGKNAPKYIVIHDTGNMRKGAGASNHYHWLETTPNTNQSAHIFVDDREAIQIIDYDTPAWHTGKLYIPKPQIPDCTNFNSIGIEFCVNEDGNLVQTLSNLVDVTKQVMQFLHISASQVITHHMSSGKQCPQTFMRNPSLYTKFKHDLTSQPVSQEMHEAISYLTTQHVMSTPDYWSAHYKEIEYLEGLILNMYHELKQANERK